MIKILDFKLEVTRKQILDFIKKEKQLDNVEYPSIVNLEEKLNEVLNESMLTLSCYFEDDYTVTVQPVLLNSKTIINNTDVLLEDDSIVFDE